MPRGVYERKKRKFAPSPFSPEIKEQFISHERAVLARPQYEDAAEYSPEDKVKIKAEQIKELIFRCQQTQKMLAAAVDAVRELGADEMLLREVEGHFDNGCVGLLQAGLLAMVN